MPFNKLKFDQSEILCGTATRTFIHELCDAGYVYYDSEIPAQNNNFALCEIVEIPTNGLKDLSYVNNFIERIYTDGSKMKFSNEDVVEKSLAIVGIGSRYTPLTFAGGLYNPITYDYNGDIKGGSIISNLGCMNLGGYLNYIGGPESPIKLKVLGILTNKKGNSINLLDFCDVKKYKLNGTRKERKNIVIIGESTESGKTTCGVALTRELKKHGYTVTFEKKTGGPRCRDWIQPHIEDHNFIFSDVGTEISLDPNSYMAGDFVDGTGCISSHSIPNTDIFLKNSLKYSDYLVQKFDSDFHIMEIAGNPSQPNNLLFLQSEEFKNDLDILIYITKSNYERVHQAYTYFTKILGISESKFILSGKIGNEGNSSLTREEINLRLNVPICKSVLFENNKTIPYGKELYDTILTKCT